MACTVVHKAHSDLGGGRATPTSSHSPLESAPEDSGSVRQETAFRLSPQPPLLPCEQWQLDHGSAGPPVALLPTPRSTSATPPPLTQIDVLLHNLFEIGRIGNPSLRIPFHTDPVPKKLFSWGGHHLFRHDPLQSHHQVFYRLRGAVLLIVEEDCSLLEEVCSHIPRDETALSCHTTPSEHSTPKTY